LASTEDDDGNALDGARPQRTIPAKPSQSQEARHILSKKIGCKSGEEAEKVIRFVSQGALGVDDIDAQPDTIHGLLHQAWESQGCEWSALFDLAHKE
jgi:hypothetical protein